MQIDPDPPLPLDGMLCFALYSAAHAVQQLYKPVLDEMGLTYPQFLVMTALWERDGRTVSSLGQALRLESNTLTPLLKRMEAAGLVSRARDPQDERQVRITLSERGRALAARAGDPARCLMERSGLDAEALAGLRAQVAAFEAVLRRG
ncbi:MarR family winged helix-turn-helix transcriptional regulator [Frigidibacter sp. MR17.24]|uniref:MarR family winged helix-turn-helix transcriptional regulator n=1 Tax=Frigidibacter sp. MR17.24 TaxID=3127345 RepID=UPI003012AEF8